MTAKKLQGGMISSVLTAPRGPGPQRFQISESLGGGQESSDTERMMVVQLGTLL